MTLQLRITVWPGQTIPLPTFEVYPSELVTTSNGTWIVRHGDPVEKALPPDFWLREIEDFDTHNAESLAAFAAQWGRFSDPDRRDVVPAILNVHGDWHVKIAQREGWLSKNVRSLEDAKVEAGKELGLWQPGQALDLRKIAKVVLTNPSEISDRIDGLRGVAHYVRELLEGKALDNAQMASQYFERLNAALGVFAVRVTVSGHVSEYDPQPTAFSAAALQIANDLAENASIRFCQNDNCPHGGVFTRQRGRAQYGEYRTSGEVKYCSSTCAKSQAQRELRRRAKNKKSNEEARNG